MSEDKNKGLLGFLSEDEASEQTVPEVEKDPANPDEEVLMEPEKGGIAGASEDADEANLSDVLSPEDKRAVEDFLRGTPDLKDKKFHEFVEKRGISPHAAETFAYSLLRKEDSTADGDLVNQHEAKGCVSDASEETLAIVREPGTGEKHRIYTDPRGTMRASNPGGKTERLGPEGQGKAQFDAALASGTRHDDRGFVERRDESVDNAAEAPADKAYMASTQAGGLSEEDVIGDDDSDDVFDGIPVPGAEDLPGDDDPQKMNMDLDDEDGDLSED